MKQKILISLLCLLLNSDCSINQKRETTNVNHDVGSSSITEVTNSNINGQTQIAPSAETLSVALTLYREGKERLVEKPEVFVEKDGIRLNVSAVEKGYLLVLYKGSDGNVEVIFPNKAFYNGKNELEPNKNIIIPNKGWFFLDAKKGTETIFVIYSKTQNLSKLTADLKQTIESFEKLRSEKNNADAFSTAEGNFVHVVEVKHE